MNIQPAKNQPLNAPKNGFSTTASNSVPGTSVTNNTSLTISLESYLENLKKQNSSEATIRNYRSDINQFLEFCKTNQLSPNQKENVDKFEQSQREKQLKDASIRRKTVSISSYLAWVSQASQKLKIEPAKQTNLPTINNIQPKDNQNRDETAGDFVVPIGIEKVLNQYLTTLKYNTISDATIRNYRSDIKQFAFFTKADSVVTLLSLEQLKRFAYSQKEKGLKPTSIQRKLVSITQFALWAQRRKLISGVTSDWSSLALDVIFNKADGPIVVTAPEKTDVAQDVKKKRRKESWLAALILLLLLFGSTIGLYLVQTVQDLRQRAYVDPNQNQQITTTTTTTTTTTDKRTLPFRGRLFSEKTGQQITGSSKASFRLYNNEKEEGEPLWESGVCDVATNPQGIFDILLGGKDESAKGCGNYLTDEIYFGNTNLWLSSTIDGEVLASYMIKTNQYAEDSGLLAGYPIGDPVVKNSVLFMNEYGEILFADQPTFSVPEGDLTLSGDNLYFITEGRGGVFSDSLITAPYAYLGGFDDTALVLQTTDKSENPLMSWIDPTGESLGVIDANGNVGIGTSKPAGLLGLGKNGAYITTQGDDLLFYDETTGALLSLSQLAVDNVGSNYWNQSGSSISYSAGNIGIGTATPEQALNVVGNIQLGIGSSDRYIYFDNGTASNAGIRYNSATSLIEFSNNGTTWEDFGSGKISSVSNSDGTLTISPTTGDVVASLNLSHANSWTGAQTFTTNTNFPNSGIWNSSGNVGIGTSAPNAPLDVRGTGVVARFAGQVVGADAVNTDEFVTLAQLNAIGAPSGIAGQNTYWETNDTLGSEAYTATVRGGLGADVTPGSAGELLYSVSGTSYGTLAAGAADQVLSIDGAGMPSWLDLSSLLIAGNDIDIVGTIIAVQDDLDLSSISASTDLGFSIYDNGGVLGLSLQDATGNIGIGTASPEQKLTAEGNLQLGTTDGTRYIYFDNGTTDNAGIRYNSTTGRLQFSDGGTIWNSFGTGDGTVTSVTNSDGSLTIFPTDGDVIAALNLGNANDWTAQQTFAGNVGINSLTTSAALTFGADTVAAGGISFGGDTNLYRSAASTLKTDDSFILGTVGTGTTSTVVTREVSGLLAARNIDARVWDGSLVGGSGTAGYVPYWSDIDTLSAEQYLSTTRGGLGGDVTALGAGELLYSTGTNTYDSVAAGTADQLLLSGGTGSPSWSNIASLLTAGDDIDITGTTNATISLEDDISLSALRASAISGLSFYDDGGNLAMFIADQGNVGIGTNTPDTVFHIDVGSNNRDIKISADAGFNTGIDLFSGTQYSQIIQETTGELSLKNRNSDENIQFIINDGGVTTTAAVIQGSSGNLGIGTSSPEQLLTVNGNIQLGVTDADRYIYFDNGTGTNAGFRYNSTSNVLEFSNNGVLWDAFGSASGSVTSVSNADGTLTISPTTGDVTASLNLGNANSWTGAQTFTANTYFPGTGIWDTNGNVGIGTASPLAKLSVGQSGTASSTLTQSSSGDLALTGSYWNGVAEALHSFKLQNIASTTVNEAGRLAFNWDSSELLTLESGGNVGIGTTTPTQKLDVAGAVRLGASGGGYDTLNTSAAAGAPSGDLYWGNRTVIDSSNISNFGVSSVTNSDGSITVSPTTGDVVSSLNVGHANDWTAQQTFAGNVGINSLTTSAALTFGADTVAAGGISFGGDTNLYRSAIGTLTTNGDVIISGGNVGIGATGELYLAAIDTLRTPDSLTVDGTFSIGTAAAGTTDDVLVLEGDGSVAKRAIDSRIWGSSLIDGSGTTNYLPKFSDLDTVTDSQLFDNGVNVGIGTALPSQKLDITGAVRLGAAGGANDVLNTSPTVGAPSGDLYWGSRTIIDSDNIQDFGVTSLTNSDGTLTISPTTGDVVASLNLGNANSWTGAQTFTTDTYFPGTSIWSSAGNIGLGTITTTSKLNFATGITAAAGINFGGDVTLYRSAADTLKTDDNFSTAGSINLGTAAIGTTNSVITREVGGDLTARSIDGRVWGSSLVDGSGTADYISYWSDANTLTSEQYLNVVRGGLGNNLTALGAGELLYSTGTTTYDSLAAGSASQLLISNGAAAPSWSNVTSLLTAGDDIDITGTTNATVSLEDDINISNLRASSIAGLALYDDAGVLGLFLQDATGNIGIGDATPIQKLDVAGAVRLGANGGTYDVLNTTPASNPPSGDLYWGDRQLIDSASIGDYGVTTLTNSDGTLTISPDTGDVVASLNLANTNTWTGLQTFNNTYTDFSAYLRHAGDGDTFLYFTDNNINVSAGGKSLLTLTENAVQDLVKLGDGTDVDVNLNDKVFVEGSSGYVGIGTASPLAKLSVGQSGTASSTLTQSSSGDLALTGSYWNGVAEALHSFKLQNIASTTVNEAGRLAFNWDSSELLTLESGGNVGIGTTTPGAKLSFAADTLATGGIDFGGDTNLYRSAVGMLTTDGDLTVAGGNIGIGGTGELYLSAANTLRTPDSLTVDGTVNVGTVGVGTTDSVITREGTGDLSARSIDSRVWGSSLVDGSGTTGYVSYWSDANTLTAEQYLNVTRGGLGGDVTALGAGELLYSTGTTTYDSLAAGSASQLLISNGAAAPSWSNVTSLLTAGDDIDITGTTNATVTLEDDIDLTALRASSAAGLSIYDDGAVLGLFLQDATGNIGVGTNAPEQKLTADGNIQLGTTDATRYIYFDNGTANNAGFRYDAVTDALQFSDNGVAWTSFNTMGTGIGTNYWTQTGSSIYYTTGNVGIGTSNPQAKLDIAGASSTISNTSGDISLNAASGSISLSGDSLTNALNGYFRGKIGIGTATPEKSLTTTGDIQLGTVNGTRYIYFDNGTANNAGIRYNSTSSVLEYSNNGTTWQGVGGGIWSQSGVDGYYSVGNIGIGTSTPASALQVLGDITPGTNDTYTLGTDTLRWKDLYLGPDSIYIGASGDQAGISYNTTSNYLSLDGNASGTDLAITAAGNVGVGSTNPLGKLQVDAADAATILNLRNTSNGGAWGMRLEGDGTTANNFHLDYGASTDKLVVRSNGYVGVPGYLGIGTTVPGARLHLVGASATTTTGGGYVTAMDIRYRGGRLEYGIDFLPELDGANSISFFNGAGTYVGGINNTVAATSYGTSSDARLKENIVESSLGLETLMRVNVRDFNFINDPTQKVNGFIAQELYQVYPDAVVVGGVDPKLNPWAVDYGRLTPLIISSVQDLAAKDLSINEYGELNIAGNSVETYAIATPTGFINRLSAYSDLMVARLKAGFIQVRELTADNITIAGQSLYDYITGIVDSRIASQPTTNPTGDADLSTLTVTNEVSGDAVLTADNNGNISALGKLSTNELEVSGASKLGSLVVTNDTEIQGDLTTTNLNVAQDATISGTLVANNVETVSSRVSYLEGRIAEFEDVKAITANVVDATVSGTLYANDIYNFDSMVAEAFKQPSLVATILGDVEQINPFTGFDLSTANAQNLNLALSDLDLAAEDIVIAPSAVFINDYLKVNGSGYIAGSLGINENLIVGDGIQIGNGAIAYKPTTGGDSVFYIQPDGTGTLSFMANLMTLTADGVVTISGDLRVAGAVDIAGEARVETSLLTNLIKPLDKNSPIQLQLGEEASMAGKVNNSRFEIVDELGTPVATISAAGKADFAGGVGVQRGDVTLSSPGIFTTTKTAGKAYLPAGTSHVTIKSESITADTLIYVTPLGSTNNQVLFVKNQIAEDQSTIVKEGNFVVGLDFPLTQDVEFNWWIVQ